MIACLTQLRIRLSLPRVLDGLESLFLLACFLWRCSIREKGSFQMEILKGRSSSSPQGPTNKQTNGSTKIRWELLGNETGWMETDIKHPVFHTAFPPQTSKHRNWQVPQNIPALKIMGSQNCWCGDPIPNPAIHGQTLHWRVQRFLGLTKKTKPPGDLCRYVLGGLFN